ncbi:MAG: phosphopentomutase, partial [Clostridiales bacterium]
MNNSHNKRIIIMVLDSLGMGALPDAAVFDGEQTGNTLGHIAAKTMMSLPNLQKIGIANIIPLDHILPLVQPMGSWGKMAARSQGKDTTTGHWEMAGLVLERPLPLYPHGFPAEIIEALTAKTGRGILGNKPASGL